MAIDFILFGLTLAGVAVFHHHTLVAALTGLALIVGYQLFFSAFPEGPGVTGLAAHLAHEWVHRQPCLSAVIGFIVMLGLLGWHPHARIKFYEP